MWINSRVLLKFANMFHVWGYFDSKYASLYVTYQCFSHSYRSVIVPKKREDYYISLKIIQNNQNKGV